MVLNNWRRYGGAMLVAALILGGQARAQTTVRMSADAGRYKLDPNDRSSAPYHWSNVTDERTIYNPLDGGVLLRYKSTYGASDGCSAGDMWWKKILIEACLAHDASYDAPFAQAGFLSYAGGTSIGKDMADYLFYLDMLTAGRAAGRSDVSVIAPVWFGQVQAFGAYRGRRPATILEKGGVFAVKNKGAYQLRCRVKWIDPRGTAREVEVSKDAGQRALIVPLSAGSRNIDTDCWALAGTNIFRRKFATVGNYGHTVDGTTLIHGWKPILED